MEPLKPAYDPAAEVVDICRDLIRIDTSNYGDHSGPGERKAAEHVATLLDEVGISSNIYESEPGRASLIARWGDGPDPLLIHGHLDVVPAAAEDWAVDPFAGEIKDDYLWGRGTVDMKDFDAMALSVVRARARAGRCPARPIVMASPPTRRPAATTARSTSSTTTATSSRTAPMRWGRSVASPRPFAGSGSTSSRRPRRAWPGCELTARGSAGHGSMINHQNAVTELAGAVARIGAYEWPVRLTPSMEVLLAAVADIAGTEATPENAQSLIDEFESSARMLGAVIRNTANPTMLNAGYKVNVIPSEASAHVDGRFLPGYEDEFFATLAELCGEHVTWEFVSKQQPWETPYDGDLVGAMNRSILAEDPDGIVAPYLMSGGTDAKHFRRLGMRSYGFAPLKLPADLDFGALFHGVDERVPVDALEFGARVFDRFLGELG